MPTTADRNHRKHENRKASRDARLREQYPTIEDWTTVLCEGELCLTGRVYNHARFNNGDQITTSRLKYIDHLLSKTQHNTYTLGEPSQDYLDYRRKHNLGPITKLRYIFS